jgi:predicted alpha/beta-hydrolase family hydrolase
MVADRRSETVPQSGAVASPLAEPPAGLIVTPGASADRDHATLVAIEDGLPELAVERLTLGTTSIKNAVKKVVAASEELAERLGVAPERIAHGGRSFGGRACSVAVAEGMGSAGLVLLSYPLHPPGKPDNLRVDHFGDLTVPALFVSGDRDPFGSPDEFEQHLGAIAGPTGMAWVPGNHSPKGSDQAIIGLIRSFFALA